MTILVIGGTGNVGSGIVRGLSDERYAVRVMTHSPDKLARSPVGVAGVVADLDAPQTLDAAFSGVKSLMLITQMHPEEETRGLAAVAAARRAGVEKIVYLSTMIRSGTEHILHYRSKRAVEEAIRASGAKFAFLRPNSFHQNDNWLREPILSGVYPQPIGGVGVNRIDAGDVSQAAVKAILDDFEQSLDVELHGPQPITGEQTAEIYAKVLGRPVAYAGDHIEAWIAPRRGVWQDWMIDALAEMYAYMQAKGVTPPEGAPQAPVLPARLVSTEDYARRLKDAWTAQTGAPASP